METCQSPARRITQNTTKAHTSTTRNTEQPALYRRFHHDSDVDGWLFVKDTCTYQENPSDEVYQAPNGIRGRKTSSSNTENVINLSQRQLSDDEQTVLTKGLNFAVPPKKTPTVDIIAGVEKGLRRIRDQDTANNIRITVRQILVRAKWPPSNLKRKCHPQLEERFLHHDPPSWQRIHHSTHGQRDLWQQDPHDHQWRQLQRNQTRPY